MDAGLTQEELAERSGLSVRGISSLEQGERRRPYPHTVRQLVAALQPSPEDQAALEASARPSATPLDVLDDTSYLPADLTPLIGRERDEAQAVHLLLSQTVRLLTLTGPGGVGKTRLATRVAQTVASELADGVVFVPLVTVGHASQVPAAVARALGVREGFGRAPEEAVLRWLQDRRALLLLDNFEHVLDAVPFIVHLLSSVPGLKLLVTSREPLYARGEQQLEVPPLALPDEHTSPPTHELTRYSAIALFLERAHAVRPDFRPSEPDIRAIAEICKRLDGLPLAIELASARLKVLSPGALLDRLEQPLEILTGGAADAPRRQQTLRATVAWSYSLLTESEQAMLRRLAVFVGGFDTHAAEAVCEGPFSGGPTTLDRLTSLVNKSLLIADADDDGEPRFRMLEMIRRFALEELDASGESEGTGRRHAEHYCRVAERAESELWGAQQATWFRRLDSDEGNLRAALEWALGRGEASVALRLGGSLWRFWIWHGDYAGWRQLLEQALSEGEAVDPALRAKGLWAVAWLAQHQGDYASARALSEENLRLARQLGDPLAIRHALNGLGMALRGLGDSRQAAELFREGVEIARTLPQKQFLAPALFNLGLAMAETGEEEQAIDLIDTALGLFRQQSEKYIAAVAARSLAHLLLARGDHHRAAPLCRMSLEISNETQHRTGMVESLEATGALCSVADRPQAAVTFFSAAEALRARSGQPPPQDSRVDRVGLSFALEPHVETAGRQLDEEARRAAEVRGREMSPTEAVTFALQEIQGM